MSTECINAYEMTQLLLDVQAARTGAHWVRRKSEESPEQGGGRDITSVPMEREASAEERPGWGQSRAGRGQGRVGQVMSFC